jgi:hypothetical protein
MNRRALAIAALVFSAAPALAQVGASSGASAAPPSAAPAPAGTDSAAPATNSATCIEHVPEGKTRPELKEAMESRGVSGHALALTLTLEHGPGETVLPSGFRLEGSGESKALEATHFFLPDPSGDAKPRLDRKDQGNGKTVTTVTLWFVPLPEKPGRSELVLPPLPIAISRASGEVMTLCTRPHAVLIEDPIANDPNPKPKPNPPPRVQREEWVAAKQAAIVAAIALAALAIGGLLAWRLGPWLKSRRKGPPPPPPRPPWVVAIESLYDTRHSGLLEEQRFAEFYDRVSDVLRRYLGDRFGYDGLESTTREALASLRRVALPVEEWIQIQEFMQDADLVKFARRTPTEAECLGVLERAERVVARTRPLIPTPPAAAPPGPGDAAPPPPPAPPNEPEVGGPA